MTQLPKRRDDHILSLLEGESLVTVDSLATQLNVSAVTVRKDLDRLSRSSLVERVRGGARLRGSDEGPLAERLGQRVGAKRAVARSAAAMVAENLVIALDSSSTGYYLALELSDRSDLTVLTNSLRVASHLAERNGPEVVVLGGTVRRTAFSTVGFPAELLRGFGMIDMAFFGVAALSVERGLLERSYSEAETKRTIAATSRQVVGLFDSTKLEGFGQHVVVSADQVSRLVTDEGFEDASVRAWTELGVNVERATV